MAPDKTSLHGSPNPSPGIWAAALATGLVLLMFLALVVVVALNAFSWFWPSPIHEVHLEDDSVPVSYTHLTLPTN